MKVEGRGMWKKGVGSLRRICLDDMMRFGLKMQ